MQVPFTLLNYKYDQHPLVIFSAENICSINVWNINLSCTISLEYEVSLFIYMFSWSEGKAIQQENLHHILDLLKSWILSSKWLAFHGFCFFHFCILYHIPQLFVAFQNLSSYHKVVTFLRTWSCILHCSLSCIIISRGGSS